MTTELVRSARMMPRSEFKAVLFDKDGTLLDYFSHWIPRVSRALGDVRRQFPGLPKMPERSMGIREDGTLLPDGVAASYAVRGIVDTFRSTLLEEGIPAGQAEAAARWFEASIAPVTTGPLPAFTDLARLFDRIHSAGMYVGVVTNDYTEAARGHFRDQGVLDSIDYLWGMDEGAPGKPDPHGILRFCRQFRIPAGEVIFVGDTPVDMEAARRAGAGMGVGVLTGAGDAPTLRPISDVLLDSVEDLPFLLRRAKERTPLLSRGRRYYHANKERILAQQHAYREAHHEEYLRYQRGYYRRVLKPRRRARGTALASSSTAALGRPEVPRDPVEGPR
ncbi:MAG: HAD family hydrolase [Dehalococcoidia bacterium]|nr:HAD family hydrolase [Dehalococcoidia bacterium]